MFIQVFDLTTRSISYQRYSAFSVKQTDVYKSEDKNPIEPGFDFFVVYRQKLRKVIIIDFYTIKSLIFTLV